MYNNKGRRIIMKAKLINKPESELTSLLKEKEQYNPNFSKIKGDKWMDTPISQPKAFMFTNLICKKYKRKIPKLLFIASDQYNKTGYSFPKVHRIFLLRPDVSTFLQQLADYINSTNPKLYNILLTIFKEKENEKWKI